MLLLISGKWGIPSGIWGIEFRIRSANVKNQEFIGVPFVESSQPSKINKIMVNAVGFGGNAVSILLSK